MNCGWVQSLTGGVMAFQKWWVAGWVLMASVGVQAQSTYKQLPVNNEAYVKPFAPLRDRQSSSGDTGCLAQLIAMAADVTTQPESDM